MIWTTITLLSLALCVLGDGHHAISEQRIKFHRKDHQGDLKHIGSSPPEHHEEYAWSYPSYEFSYKVHDPHTHDMKGHEESRNGDDVKGEYWLIQPDGQKRTVTYHADKHSGFKADVKYSEYHHEKDDHGDDKKHGEEESIAGEEEQSDDAGKGKDGMDGGDEGHDDKGHKEEGGHDGEESRSHKGFKQAWVVARHEHAKQESRMNDRRGYNDMTILGNMGSFGRKESGRGRYEGRDFQESRAWESQRHTQQARPHIQENYNNPRFYRQIQGRRPRQ